MFIWKTAAPTKCMHILVFFAVIHSCFRFTLKDGDISDTKWGHEMTSEFKIYESVCIPQYENEELITDGLSILTLQKTVYSIHACNIIAIV